MNYVHGHNFLHNGSKENEYIAYNKSNNYSEKELHSFVMMILDELDSNISTDCKKFKKPHTNGSHSVVIFNDTIRIKLKTLRHGLSWESYIDAISKDINYKYLTLTYMKQEYIEMHNITEYDILYISYDGFNVIQHTHHPIQAVCVYVALSIIVVVLTFHYLTRGKIF